MINNINTGFVNKLVKGTFSLPFFLKDLLDKPFYRQRLFLLFLDD